MSMGVGVKRCPTCDGVGWLRIDQPSDDDEPINLELVYVFIENEFPRKPSDEPTTASLTGAA